MQSASINITTFPGKVGISNANPTHTLAIGSNVYVDDTGSNKLTVTGVISGDGLGISNIQTANVLGLTDNVTRITTLETDLDNNSTRITNLSSDLADNSTRITIVSSNLSDNSSRITTVSSDLADNSSRIDSLGDGAHTFTGVKTFEDDIILESNLRVNGSLTYANTVNMIVSDPIIELGANNQHTNDLGLVLTRHGNLGNDSNVAIFYDESQDNLKIGYTDNSASETTLTTTATGLDVSITGNVAAAYDTDTTSYFGRAALGYMGQSDQASFSHIDKNTSTNFALKQAASGATHLNTPTGQHIRFSVNASEVGRFTGGGDFKVGNNPVKFYVDTALSEVQMYSQATGSTAGPALVLMRDNGSNAGSNNQYIGQIRYEGLNDNGNSLLYAKTTGKIKTAANNSEDGVIETMIKTGGSNRISVRHSGAKFLITNGTDLQVGEVANLYVDTSTSRVGIKKSNPSYTLDVDGDINLSGDFYQGGSPFVSSLWTSSGTDLYYSSGSVGISNAAPNHDLSVGSNLYVHDTGSNVLVVDGNVNVSNTLTVDRLTLNNVSISTTQDLAQVSNVGNVTSNILQFTNPTTAFVTTGAVGIGTTSPEQKLHIEDSANPRILIENTDGILSLNQDIGSIIFKQNDNSLTGTGTIGKIRMSSVTANDGGNFYGEAANMIFSVGKFANDNANIDALTIKNDGNVHLMGTSQLGIGYSGGALPSTTSPLNTQQWSGTDDTWEDMWHHKFDATWNFRMAQYHDNNVEVKYGIRQKYNSTEYTPLTFRGNRLGIFKEDPAYTLDCGPLANGAGMRITRQNGQSVGLRLEDQNLTSDGSATRAANLQYQFVLSAPRPGQSENGLTMFINSANRTQDGGASCATIRNDNGPIRLGSVAYNTTVDGSVIWLPGSFQLGNAGADYAFHAKKFTSSVNVQNLTLDFDLNYMYRGGIVKVWLTSGVSGQATVATWSRKVVAFSWKATSNLAQTVMEDEEQHTGNAITISMPSNGTLRVQGSMYSSFSYPMMEAEVTYAGGVRA